MKNFIVVFETIYGQVRLPIQAENDSAVEAVFNTIGVSDHEIESIDVIEAE